MWIFDCLKALFPGLPVVSSVRELGALPDNRTAEEKTRDANFAEVVASAATVTWIKKDSSTFRKFGVQDQKYTSSCVSHAVRKALRILFLITNSLELDFSATDIYRRRSNFPDEGMSGPDAIKITANGVQLNALMPSDNLTENQMNHPVVLPGAMVVADYFKVPQWIILPIQDIETIASVIQQTGKGVVLFQFFTEAEWSKFQPTVDATHWLTQAGILRHAVCAVDFTLNDKNEKCLVIEDSAHFGGFDVRLLTEEVIKTRNYWAAYPMNFKFKVASSSKPTFTDKDVVSLQDCLKYDGSFPANVGSTGVYGGITIAAVETYQRKYSLPVSGYINDATRADLHTRFP